MPCCSAWQCGHFHASSWASWKGSHGDGECPLPVRECPLPARGAVAHPQSQLRHLLLLGVELETLVQGAAVLLVGLLLPPHAVRVLDPLLLEAPEQAASSGDHWHQGEAPRALHPPHLLEGPHRRIVMNTCWADPCAFFRIWPHALGG